MKVFLIYKILLLVGFFAIAAFAQDAHEKLEIINADISKHSMTQNGALLEMIGNVKLQQGAAKLYCSHAKYWKNLNEALITDNVRIYDGNKTLIADSVYYYGDPKIFKAVGHVSLSDSSHQLTARRIFYYKIENKAIAEHNVVMKDSSNFIDIFSDYAELHNNEDYAIITGQPVFIKYDSTGKEDFRIKSKKMELFDGGDKAVITDSVIITQKKAISTCGKAEFYRTRDEIYLKENPVVEQSGDHLRGNIIQLFIKGNKLDKAVVKENALVTARVDTTGQDDRINKMTGQLITMFFIDQEINKVIVEGQATSYYHILEENEDKGLNKIIGDRITVFIKKREIDRILIESNPQLSSGKFFPSGKSIVGEEN